MVVNLSASFVELNSSQKDEYFDESLLERYPTSLGIFRVAFLNVSLLDLHKNVTHPASAC